MNYKDAGRLRGTMTAIFTPMDLHGELELSHFPALLAFQQNAGIDGVVVNGTNGEAVSLTVAERKAALETAMAHRGGMTVVAGTGAASVEEAVDLTKHAAEVGADAALVLPPFFFKSPSALGLRDYFMRVLDSASIPLLLYNIPQFTAVPITDDLLGMLAGHPNLAGVKDSAGDLPRTLEFINRYPALRIFAGSDRLDADCYTAGGAGCISGGANAFPELLSAVRDGFKSGGEAGARAAQARLDTLLDITVKYPFITSGKAIIANRGLPRLGVRPPLTILPQDAENKLIAELKSAELM